MRFLRFRVRSFFVLLTVVAVLIRLTWVFVLPHKREHDAFTRLSPRLLYAGAYSGGSDWHPKIVRDYLMRFHTLRIRIESTDTDSGYILNDLYDFPSLTNIELVSGDPYPQTKENMAEFINQLGEKFPTINVTVIP